MEYGKLKFLKTRTGKMKMEKFKDQNRKNWKIMVTELESEKSRLNWKRMDHKN